MLINLSRQAYKSALTIQSVQNPEKEATERESQGNDKKQQDESRSRLELELDDADGVQHCWQLSVLRVFRYGIVVPPKMKCATASS